MPVERPENIHGYFADAANRGDAVALADLYEPDAVIVERDGSRTTGHDAVRAHLEQLVAMRPQMQIVESRVITHDGIALLCSQWRATATPPGHEAALSMEFRGSEIARRREDGTWRLIVDNPWGIDTDA